MIPAEYFDLFGFIGFAIILFSGIKIIKSKDKSIRKYGWIIILIGIIGLIVDGYVVIGNFVLD